MGFCIIIPADYDTMLNKPAVELALSEVAAARGLHARISYITSGYGLLPWRWYNRELMRELSPRCRVGIVAGLDGFAGAYIDDGYAVLGGWAFWALNWGDDNVMPRTWTAGGGFPWGVYLNRRSQMGAVDHEVGHLLCRCGEAGHRTSDVPWWNRF